MPALAERCGAEAVIVSETRTSAGRCAPREVACAFLDHTGTGQIQEMVRCHDSAAAHYLAAVRSAVGVRRAIVQENEVGFVPGAVTPTRNARRRVTERYPVTASKGGRAMRLSA